jgi:putative membrane protein
MLFVGLILGSVPFIIKMHDDMKISLRRASFFVLAMAAILSTLIFGVNDIESVNYVASGELLGVFNSVDISFVYGLWLLVCGFLAAGSMVLPGFSGSALLISLGEYNNILQFVDQRMIVPVALVALGAIPGVVFFAKIINRFLTKYPSDTYYFILGLITASIVQIFNEISDTIILSGSTLLISILTFFIGIVISYFLSKIHK